jgi:PfaD family protein
VPDRASLVAALHDVRRSLCLVRTDAGDALAEGGSVALGPERPAPGALPVSALVAPCPPENLGDASFRADHGLRYAYVAGAMANGIGSCEIVEAMARAGMVGFFGAAGLPVERVAEAVDRLQSSLGDAPHGFNLIHSPNEPHVEAAVADLYVQRGVRLVSASAYLGLTLPLVRYRLHGIHRSPDGRVATPNRVIAKVSRVEVASHFLAPAPEAMVRELVARGDLTEEQAALTREVPVAQDLTAEADSGGHTDNRPALALLPTMLALRDRMQEEHEYAVPLRVGAAGGISTPASAAAAYALGAAYALTGSVNQACVEAGTSDTVREMLAAAEQADVAMAPAADMFEMGVKVQVLKRGTMFAMRAAKLFEMYRAHQSLDELTPAERGQLEKSFFRMPLDEVWRETEAFFGAFDPGQLERAERDAHHKMALVFRWYLGKSSTWANSGEPARKVDYQVWCGPAMGAFNEWARESYLERPESRTVVTVARNLLHGAAVLTRVHQLRAQGVTVPADAASTPPLAPDELEERFR